jgi:ferredoxin
MSEDGNGETDASGGSDHVSVTVIDGEQTHDIRVERGATLRDELLAAGRSPHTTVTERLNCGGRGLCGTCGVRIRSTSPPDHWHDRLAARFGYPRLSCQVTVDEPMTVELVADKRVWGGRE